MPSGILPGIEERSLPNRQEDYAAGNSGPYIVILYNDDYHSFDEVVFQLQKATGYAMEPCIAIMLEAHTLGRAVAFTGSESECERVASVLRQIRLQVETDRC